MDTKNQDYLYSMRHSAEHVLNKAMVKLFPGLKMAMGPATAEGFYFDFDYDKKITEEDFPKIEEEMQNIIKKDEPFIKKDVSAEEAQKLFVDNEYKLEWIDEIEKRGEKPTLYQTGDDFVDLCFGPHVESTGKIGAFKLLSVAGAYWRGDEKNKMLTRIYGTAFSTQEELEEYLKKREEMKKRDHRKLGKELDLFTFSDLVGAGLPLFTPKGTFLRNTLQEAVMEISKKYGYQQVTIPHIAKIALYETSGHAQKFGGELFKVLSHYNEEFVMKPVNCPHHTQIYASRPRSYKDLPIRYIESTMQYRDEKPGEIGGLTRVRSITVDDGHLFCTPDQVKEEAKNICLIIEQFYKKIGLWGQHWVSLSVRDPKDFSKYIGEEKDWDKAEKMLEELAKELNLGAKKVEGEAAIYGPKIDFMFTDSLGREWQLATVQLDFAMPQRFGLEYSDNDGDKKTPVMIHRAILGSYERFMAILIEHFGGAFPTWLSPLQVQIVPITDRNNKYGQNVLEQLLNSNIRVELDNRAETMQAKIRDAAFQKIPYMVIIGDREEKDGKVAVRTRDGKDLGTMDLKDFIEKVRSEIESKGQV